jgi:hypothetical protein
MSAPSARLRNRHCYVERGDKGSPRVGVGASFLETVHDRPSRGGEGGVEFVMRIVVRNLNNDGSSSKSLVVEMSSH